MKRQSLDLPVLRYVTAVLALLLALAARPALAVEPCEEVLAESFTPAESTLAKIGDQAVLDLVVFVDGDTATGEPLCSFDPASVTFRQEVESLDGETIELLLDIDAPQVRALEDTGEATRYLYEVPVTAVDGPGVASVIPVYQGGAEPYDLRQTAQVVSESRLPETCYVDLGAFDPLSVLLTGEDIVVASLTAEVFGMNRGCKFLDDWIRFDVVSEEEPVITIEVSRPDILGGPIGAVTLYRYFVTLRSLGQVGASQVQASYDVELSNPSGQASTCNVSVAELREGVMELDGTRVRDIVDVPADPLSEPSVITVELSEEELAAIESGQKDRFVIPAGENAPGLVAHILEHSVVSYDPLLVQLVVQAEPASAAFSRYHARVPGETVEVALQDDLAEGEARGKAGKLKCDLKPTVGKVSVEMFSLSGELLTVTPVLMVDIVDGELVEMEFVTHVDSSFHFDGPSITAQGAGYLTGSCEFKLKKIPLPPPIVTGPFTFHPTMEPSVGGDAQITVSLVDLRIQTVAYEFELHHKYGFHLDGYTGELTKIVEAPAPRSEVVGTPDFFIDPNTQAGDLQLKIAPFVNFGLGAGVDFLFFEIGSLELIKLKLALEAQLDFPFDSWWAPPHDEYRNPTWSFSGVAQAGVDTTVKWGPWLRSLGLKEWRIISDLELVIYKRTFPYAGSPGAELSLLASPPHYLYDENPVRVDLKGFSSIFDFLLYQGQTATFYVRHPGGGWLSVGTATVEGSYVGPDSRLSAELDLGSVLSPGDWEVVAVVEQPFLRPLQSDVETLSVVTASADWAPGEFDLSGGGGEVLQAELKLFNSEGTAPAAYTVGKDSTWIALLSPVSGEVAPQSAVTFNLTFTCTSPDPHEGSITLGGDIVGSIPVHLDCQSYRIEPRKLSFELEAGGTDHKPFTIHNDTASTLRVKVEMDESVELDHVFLTGSSTPPGTQTLPAGTDMSFDVHVACDNPGTREGAVRVTNADNAGELPGFVTTRIECKPADGDGNGGSAGDPHFVTFDGKKYNFQGRGEYVLARYQAPGSGLAFEVQTRQVEAVDTTRNVTLNRAVALAVGTDLESYDYDRVGFYAQGPDPDTAPLVLKVNGVDSPLADGDAVSLPFGGEINRRAHSYWVSWPALAGTTPIVLIRDHGKFLNVEAFPTAPMSGAMTGVLGNWNGLADDEPFFTDGTKVDLSQSKYCFDPGCFAYGPESWLVELQASPHGPLFDYVANEYPGYFTPDPNDPMSPDEPDLDDFSAAEVTAAYEICMAGEAHDVIEACALDLLLTQDVELALSNSDLTVPPSVWNEVSPSPISAAVYGYNEYHQVMADDGDVAAFAGSGQIEIYRRSGDLWALEAVLDNATEIGPAVDISGDLLVTGNENANGGEGAVYVYEHQEVNGNWEWTRTATLGNPDQETTDFFACAVATDGETIVVGANRDIQSGIEAGSIWIYQRNASGGWSEVRLAPENNPFGGMGFGFSLDIDGERIYVGATLPFAYHPNYVFIYRHEGTAWVFEQSLQGNVSSDDFGSQVVAEGNLLAVTLPGAATNQDDKVFLFQRAEDGWWSEVFSTSCPMLSGTTSIDLDGGKLLLGCPMNGGSLALYEYRPASGTWEAAAIQFSGPPPASDHLGYAVVLADDTIFAATDSFGVLAFENQP